MFRHEQRDKSGPMDVDNPDPMARLAQYAIPPDDGPSRKRQSSEGSLLSAHRADPDD
jgi:hypothetical protein